MELKHCHEDTERGTLKIKPASAHLRLFSLLAAGGEMTHGDQKEQQVVLHFALFPIK